MDLSCNGIEKYTHAVTFVSLPFNYTEYHKTSGRITMDIECVFSFCMQHPLNTVAPVNTGKPVVEAARSRA